MHEYMLRYPPLEWTRRSAPLVDRPDRVTRESGGVGPMGKERGGGSIE